MAKGIGDLEKLIHDFEFENQQYVKEIEKEKQEIAALRTSVGEHTHELQRQQEQTPQLDEDIKRYHKQFTVNRDNIESLKTTVDILVRHEEVLVHKLESLVQKEEMERAKHEGMLRHYEVTWNEYKDTYDNMELAKQLSQKQQLKSEIVTRHNALSSQIEELMDKIRSIQIHNGAEWTPCTNINQLMLKLANIKVKTMGHEKEIRLARAQCRQRQSQIDELKQQKEEELRMQAINEKKIQEDLQREKSREDESMKILQQQQQLLMQQQQQQHHQQQQQQQQQQQLVMPKVQQQFPQASIPSRQAQTMQRNEVPISSSGRRADTLSQSLPVLLLPTFNRPPNTCVTTNDIFYTRTVPSLNSQYVQTPPKTSQCLQECTEPATRTSPEQELQRQASILTCPVLSPANQPMLRHLQESQLKKQACVDTATLSHPSSHQKSIPGLRMEFPQLSMTGFGHGQLEMPKPCIPDKMPNKAHVVVSDAGSPQSPPSSATASTVDKSQASLTEGVAPLVLSVNTLIPNNYLFTNTPTRASNTSVCTNNPTTPDSGQMLPETDFKSPKTPATHGSSGSDKSPFDLERQLSKIRILQTQSPGQGFSYGGRYMFDNSHAGEEMQEENDGAVCSNTEAMKENPALFSSFFTAGDSPGFLPAQHTPGKGNMEDSSKGDRNGADAFPFGSASGDAPLHPSESISFSFGDTADSTDKDPTDNSSSRGIFDLFGSANTDSPQSSRQDGNQSDVSKFSFTFGGGVDAGGDRSPKLATFSLF